MIHNPADQCVQRSLLCVYGRLKPPDNAVSIGLCKHQSDAVPADYRHDGCKEGSQLTLFINGLSEDNRRAPLKLYQPCKQRSIITWKQEIIGSVWKHNIDTHHQRSCLGESLEELPQVWMP